MGERDIQNQIISHMDDRLDQIEKLITLSLINDVLPQYTECMYKNLSSEIKDIIEKCDFQISKSEVFSDQLAVYLRAERKAGIKEFRELKKLFHDHGQNAILVFELDKVTSIQRKKYVEEKISYYITGKELFISKD